MSSCSNCGAGVLESTRFCQTCGTAVASGIVPQRNDGQTIEVQGPQPSLWHVTYATGQRGGPFTENDIRGMIARQELKVTDSIVAQGGNTWVPITQSPFASVIVQQLV
jgi:GYF domain 2